jgi:hypothetical protein
MIIMTPEVGTKTLNLIPREENMAYITLRDDSNNTTETYTIDNLIVGEWYFTVQFELVTALLENRYYDLTIFAGDDTISYKDRIYVTSQTAQDFSVNNQPNGQSKYKSNNSANDFLTYGE